MAVSGYMAIHGDVMEKGREMIGLKVSCITQTIEVCMTIVSLWSIRVFLECMPTSI